MYPLISCYISSQQILYLKFAGILKIAKIRESKKIQICKIQILNLWLESDQNEMSKITRV